MAKKKELTNVSDKLEQLEALQAIHSKIDEIRVLKGELPIEVADLEDEITGLERRVEKIDQQVEEAEENINTRKQGIKDANALIIKYEKQLNNVKNNREFDALNKEIEMQKLEIQLHEKKIKERNLAIENYKESGKENKDKLKDKKDILKTKKKELDHIIEETEKEEKELSQKADYIASGIEDRLITAYNRIRGNYKNGLAVVHVKRDACGGCFGFIPPQTQSEIRTKRKLISCEHCGRILVDVEDDVEV